MEFLKNPGEEYRDELISRNDFGMEIMPFAIKIAGEIIAKIRVALAFLRDFQSRFRTKSSMKKMGAILKEIPKHKNRIPNDLYLSFFLIKDNPKNIKPIESK